MIASGGGGIPVIEKGPRLIGKEGVVDKDLAAAILAHEVAAQVLLILTDVQTGAAGLRLADARGHRTHGRVRGPALLKRGEFGGGSMGPKVEAAVRFVRDGDRRAVIAELDQARAALAGAAGTEIVAAPS